MNKPAALAVAFALSAALLSEITVARGLLQIAHNFAELFQVPCGLAVVANLFYKIFSADGLPLGL